ncbi:MAG: HisA/HisF-related TIM barrel protein, partial [Planctomycetaceae bacterium]
MQVLPVLDLLNSVVVRGVAGHRDTYRPVESEIAASAHPIDVAVAFRESFGLNQLYVADLDAILRGEPNWQILSQLQQEGFELLVDAGVSNVDDATAVLQAGASQVIAGLETWPLLSSLEMLLRRLGEDRVLFSLDLTGGRPISQFRDLPTQDPVEIGTCVLEAGARKLIILDLDSVGTGSGIPTVALCRELKDFAPRCHIITGGGVRSDADLDQLAAEPIDGVLIASALHDGSL